MERQISDLEKYIEELEVLIDEGNSEDEGLQGRTELKRTSKSFVHPVASPGGVPDEGASDCGTSSLWGRAAACNALQRGQAGHCSEAVVYCEEHEIEQSKGEGVCIECNTRLAEEAKHWQFRRCPYRLCDQCGTKLIYDEDENEDKVAKVTSLTKKLDAISQSAWVKVLDENSDLGNGELETLFLATREGVKPFSTLGERRKALSILAEILAVLDELS